MSLPLFFTENEVVPDLPVLLNEETSRHVVQVLRMKQGERLGLTDGKGRSWITSLLDVHKKKATVAIEQTIFQPLHPVNTAIAVSLIKNNSRFEWLLEKATELGISGIYPLLSERTEKQNFRYDRMRNILVSALLQSRQVWMPVLHTPIAFNDLLETTTYEQKFIAHCEPDKKTPFSAVLDKKRSAIILIGPEGDFTPSEIGAALGHQFIPVALGETRLRTETAGIAAATLMRL